MPNVVAVVVHSVDGKAVQRLLEELEPHSSKKVGTMEQGKCSNGLELVDRLVQDKMENDQEIHKKGNVSGQLAWCDTR